MVTSVASGTNGIEYLGCCIKMPPLPPKPQRKIIELQPISQGTEEREANEDHEANLEEEPNLESLHSQH